MARLESVYIAVHGHRCARVRNRNASCRACADACTSGCISYENGLPVVDPAVCVGCGTCATACPTCALEARNPTDAELLRVATTVLRASGDASLTFGEHRVLHAAGAAGRPDLQAAVPVENVGRIDESLLVSLAAAGAERVVFVHARRDEPDTGAQTARVVIESTRTLLDAWDCPLLLELVEEDAPVQSSVQPADTAEPTAGTAPGAVEAPAFDYRQLRVMRDGTLPHFVPDRRERLLDALADLGDPVNPQAPLPTRLWAHVTIDPERCTSCRLCAVFCPTGALAKFDDPDGAFGVEHNPADCVKCRCCRDICRHYAISIDDGVPAGALMGAAPERIEMKQVKRPHGTPNSILNAWKDLTGLDQLYER